MVAYARALSRSSTIEESEEEESLVKRSEVEKKLKLRRKLALIAILLFSLVAASILLFCVANKIKRQSSAVEDIVCAPNDVACIASLCPTGMTWQPEENQCLEQGEARIGVEQSQARIGHAGVVPSPLARCDLGYVWVSHRQKCLPHL